MRQITRKRSLRYGAPILFTIAASALLLGCGSGASVPATAPPVATATATLAATATALPAALPTTAPLPPASPTAPAPTTVRQAASPAAASSNSAKATTAPVASSPIAPTTGAKRDGGGSLTACDVITKADVEAVLGGPVLMPPAGVPGAGLPAAIHPMRPTGRRPACTLSKRSEAQGYWSRSVSPTPLIPHPQSPSRRQRRERQCSH